jgi:predicted ATP-dependent serine protease
MQVEKFVAYRICIVAGQISQSVNITSTHVTSRVVVTGDTTVGVSTLITRVTASQSQWLLALIYVSCELYLLKISYLCMALKVLSPMGR